MVNLICYMRTSISSITCYQLGIRHHPRTKKKHSKLCCTSLFDLDLVVVPVLIIHHFICTSCQFLNLVWISSTISACNICHKTQSMQARTQDFLKGVLTWRPGVWGPQKTEIKKQSQKNLDFNSHNCIKTTSLIVLVGFQRGVRLRPRHPLYRGLYSNVFLILR